MKKADCLNEKYSSRLIGLILLALALGLGFIGLLILPIVGLIFSVPLFILAITLFNPPISRVLIAAIRYLKGRLLEKNPRSVESENSRIRKQNRKNFLCPQFSPAKAGSGQCF